MMNDRQVTYLHDELAVERERHADSSTASPGTGTGTGPQPAEAPASPLARGTPHRWQWALTHTLRQADRPGGPQ